MTAATRPHARWPALLLSLGMALPTRAASADSTEPGTTVESGVKDIGEEGDAGHPSGAPEPGQAEFERGVALTREERWDEAIAAFHASLDAADRPATRYNLARAYAATDAPLEAARQALAFLALPRSPHRGAARAELESLLAETLKSLAILELTVTPPGAQVRVDGQPPDVTDHAGRVYLKPGTHTLQVHAPGHLPFASSRLLPSGQVTTVAVALALEPTEPETIVTTVPVRWRKPLALSLAATGGSLWVAGLATWAAARVQRSDVGALDPTAPGALDRALRYANLRDAALPLALAGGSLAAAGAMVAERAPPRRWSWAPLAVGTALAATGLVFAVEPPNSVGSWNTAAPSRALGYVLIGAALPALGLGARWLWQQGNVEVAAGPLGVRGRF